MFVVIVHCNLSVSWFKSIFPHTSGLWCLLCHEAETNFETLRAGNPSYFFVYSEDKKKSGEIQVENDIALNKIHSETRYSVDIGAASFLHCIEKSTISKISGYSVDHN